MSQTSRSKTKSLIQLRTQRFPDNLFLEDGILLRAQVNWRAQRNIGGDIENRRALERKVRSQIRRLVDEHNRGLVVRARESARLPEDAGMPDDLYIPQDEMPLTEDARLEFVEYREVNGVPGYEWFVCRHPSCERLYHLKEALTAAFKCPRHKWPLSQLAHIFVHNVCGYVEMMKPEECWNDGCDATMRLHLHPPNMRLSYRWCPECRKKGLPERSKRTSDGGWTPSWKRDLFRYCPVCRSRTSTHAQLMAMQRADSEDYVPEEPGEDRGGRVRMGLTTARTAFKPVTLTTVDMPGADESVLLDEWFQVSFDIDEIRAQLPEAIRDLFDSDSDVRYKILKAKRAERGSINGAPIDPPGRVRETLRDYAGARSTVSQTLDQARPDDAAYLLDKCGVRVSMLDGLTLINATLGYLIGSSDPSQAQLNIFHMGGDRYAILTERLQTEAILIELDPEQVLEWLQKRGYQLPVAAGDTREQALRRHLLTQADSAVVLDQVTGLTHTMSHLLIRTSERVTGVSRDTLQEIVWPRALAFVLYNGSGTDLGMLQTAFEGSMFDWFHGARYDAANCPYDPVCRASEWAACHACLYIAERNCNTYWNRWLDRRHLVTFQGGPIGYWGAAG